MFQARFKREHFTGFIFRFSAKSVTKYFCRMRNLNVTDSSLYFTLMSLCKVPLVKTNKPQSEIQRLFPLIFSVLTHALPDTPISVLCDTCPVPFLTDLRLPWLGPNLDLNFYPLLSVFAE